MTKAGHALIWIGFVAAAYTTVLDPRQVVLGPFLACLAASVAGVAVVRVASHRAACHEDHLAASFETLAASLQRIADNVERLDRDRQSIGVYDLRHEIERAFPADIEAFADARQSIGHSFGLEAYAQVMNPFAAGERYLNRVWSASTDGYVDEAHAYLAKARDQFRQALETFRALTPTAA